MTTTQARTPPGQSELLDENLTRRALRLVASGTTDMAPDVLSVPLSYYRDPEILRRERQEILEVTPLALVPTAQMAAPHDYVVREVLGRSVLVSRDSRGEARAFLNYCRHRGARPAEGCGNSRRITCPYHGWSYDSAGRLVGIPGREGFSGIDPADHGLVELPSEERHGFVWVVLTAGADLDLDAHLGPLDAELGRWQYQDYGYLTERTTGVPLRSQLEECARSVRRELPLSLRARSECDRHEYGGQHVRPRCLWTPPPHGVSIQLDHLIGRRAER